MNKVIAGIVATAGLAFITHSIIEDNVRKTAGITGDRSKDVNLMLQNLQNKTSKEKLESAYDAAIQTHEIGFPQSKSKK